MFAFKKLNKITYGVLGSAAAVALVWGCTSDKKRTVLASWTTNHMPSSQWDHNWDRRDPKNMVKPVKSPEEENKLNSRIEKVTPVASRHLFLIRHGQYFMNGESEESKYLTELGKAQADLTGKRLKELGHNYTSLVYSTMVRAAQTAEIISKHLEAIPMVSCDLLREGAPIPPEPPVGHWKPEVQQFYEDGARIEAAFRKYFHRAEAKQEKDSYEIFVCHANVIRYFVCRALQFPPEAWLRIGLNNSSITSITIRPSGRVYLRTLGDSGHIPAEKLTTL